ncbi:TonB-dependent vitamin B12 receptor [Vibrio sp. MEBiC08052]|uniref:TonB-dependent vitamin B12 receptor n=1 Tax=Vibrio sp. MEBiC08052 TaxID=1761910 RepID=UPI000740659C|nr:TonB-dependent vitamin B12 receptor [Vibrio sp. MEBiC08052]KUI96935.1 hypothetical protein VRK_39370 [Vibrio sp. MEBiC08052]
MKKTVLAIAVVSQLSCAFYSYADSSNADTDTMVVTANRFEQPAQSTLADVEVITQQDIHRSQAKSIPQLLRNMIGIEISQNGGRGQNSSLFVRGTSSTQVLVLLDGARFARAAIGSVDFNQIPLTYVERIEYVRGARASLYGSEAIGGVINIITKARSQQEETQLSVGLGSLDSQEISVTTGFKVHDNNQLNVAVGHESTDGYNVHPVSGKNDGDRHGFETNNALIGYVHDVNQQVSLFGNVRAYDNTYQYDSRGNKYESEKEDIAAGFGGKYKSDNLQSEVQLSTQRQKSWRYEQSLGKGSAGTTQDEVKQHTAQWINSYTAMPSLILSGGVDWREDSYDDITNHTQFSHDNFGLYGLASFHHDKTKLEVGIRNDDNEDFGNKATYNLAAGYQLIPEFGVKASYGTAFKGPDLYQLHDATYGNVHLKPESSQNAELGFHGVIQTVYWSLTGYDYQIDDLINYEFSSNSYNNIDGTSRIKGVELTSEFDTGIVQHRISAEYKDARDAKNELLPRRAHVSYKWNMTASFDVFDLSVNYLYIGKRDNSAFDTVTLPSYSLVDTAINYQANESVTIGGRIDNLFDKSYETSYGYPSPSRAYSINITYTF